jgi:hypothetical protein
MLGPNQTSSDGTGVDVGIEVLVGFGVGGGIVVSVGLGGFVGIGVSSTICGMLQAATDSARNIIILRGNMQ